MTIHEKNKSIDPQFIEFLSSEDKEQYYELRANLTNLENKYKKNKRLSSLQNALDAIREFCEKGKDDDWKRYLVCGACWYGSELGINTRQLRLLLNKCKSSINGALSKMGYEYQKLKIDEDTFLTQKIPYLKENINEKRMWTARRKVTLSPYPMFHFYYSPAAYMYQTPQPILVAGGNCGFSENMFNMPGYVNHVQPSILYQAKADDKKSDHSECFGDKVKSDPCCCFEFEDPMVYDLFD